MLVNRMEDIKKASGIVKTRIYYRNEMFAKDNLRSDLAHFRECNFSRVRSS